MTTRDRKTVTSRGDKLETFRLIPMCHTLGSTERDLLEKAQDALGMSRSELIRESIRGYLTKVVEDSDGPATQQSRRVH